jgi:dTMP kinase
MNGKLIMIDGIDGCGKSSLVESMAKHLAGQGKKIFDLTRYCRENKELPSPEFLLGYDIILSNEPTYSWVGLAIRKEIISNNERNYSAKRTAEYYAADREILYRRIIIPMLESGKTVINDRGVSTSIISQPIQAEPLSLENVISIEGNHIALDNRPDLLIIAIVNPLEAVRRLNARSDKNDDAIFERLDFLKKADERFRSGWFRELFESRGSKVAYVDMNRTIDEEIADAVRIYDSMEKK